ncbi:amino acid ABC transporter substrate-binding protein [Synechococcus sp. HB1133]|uniref:substrate-binding periplasmic protein n=1 Tax=unclassified Synechococcus TaxID=2626047 RepID=UPI00140869DA|nr:MULTISPECIES: transporter substrate-binding domain-containing protein [unclassified Synechococcus]MCB4394437.1 amino acid ABC transporter substrate-binding protein [Synechococcus sp. PH41509]MCB4423621.1 amino acid ABC transporter substrate-binding protein [Synechococcus sp. HB1133]MCB4431530.1 amino acid ABC transporter substrate-binding protein [Synechococcus sp. HBA1120]NHI82568.1 transporter substrate-binding domain-containing protein [Synechococcus sp. HB1133]
MNYKALGLKLGLVIMTVSATITGATAIANETPSWAGSIVKVGTVDDYLPCSDQIDQHFEGLSIDIWRRISERLNISYTMQPISSFDQAVALAANGEFDLIASCHEITPERLQSIEYAIPYTTGGIVIASQQSKKPVISLVSKIIQNKIVVRCSVLLIAITGLTAWSSSYFNNSRPASKLKARRLTKVWTFLILNDGIDTIVGNKIRDHITVLITSLVHTLLMGAIIGTTATIIFEENITKRTNELANKELYQLLQQGLAVQKETSNAHWLEKQMNNAGITLNMGATPIYASDKQHLMELIQGKSDPNPKHMVTNITTYKTILKQAELEDEFELSYQMPSKTPQAFVFGSNINQELKKAINVEIAKLNRSGLTEQIEKDWRD